jgi:putative ABC transport system permease protein
MRFEHWLYTLPLRWRSIVRRARVDRDLDDEIADHVACRVDELVARGFDRAEAVRVVRREFGGVGQVKERCRDARGVDMIETLSHDVRYAARTLGHNPGYAAAAILTLGLGIGANTAVFSLADGILIARLPYAAPEQLIAITGTYPNGAFAGMREEIRSFDAAAYAEGHWFRLNDDGTPTRVAGARVSAGLFPMLGAKPALGRWLRDGEDAAPRDHVVILSHTLWQARFAGDATVVGRFVEIDGLSREIVAVMPASFQFPSSRTQLWIPLGLDSRNTARYWAGDFMPVLGRLRPHATISQARSEIQSFQTRIHQRFPWPMPSDWNQDVTVVPLQEAMVGSVRLRLLILIAAVALVLLTACANVANLSLSKAVAREREIAIRTAIGATPRRIARQLLTESVLLALLGGIAGLLMAGQAIGVLKLVLPPDTPRLAEVQLNWRMLLFAGAIAIVTGCMFGFAPVVHALRVRLRTAMESGTRGGGRVVAGPLRAALTVAQIACAVLLVIAAGLLVRSLWGLSHADPGFRPDHVMTARISPAESICATADRCLAFYRALETQLAVEGVPAAGLVNTLPLTGAVAKRSLELEGYVVPPSRNAPLLWLNAITPEYFRVMGIRLEAGRAFAREDLAGRPRVAIVSASTARRFWPGQNAVGKQIRFVGEDHWHTVVGIAADVRAYDLKRLTPDWIDGLFYVPHGPNATMEGGRIPTSMTLTITTGMTAEQLWATLRRVIDGVSREVVVDEVRAMQAIVTDTVATPAATTSLLVAMAGLALALGCLGVYGVLSFLVSRQRRDLGIRFALGAQRRDVFWLVIKEGASLCLAGVAAGVIGAIAVTRWLSSELYGISATDPVTYVAVVGAVSMITLMACYVPSRRAMAVDPLTVLREE